MMGSDKDHVGNRTVVPSPLVAKFAVTEVESSGGSGNKNFQHTNSTQLLMAPD